MSAVAGPTKGASLAGAPSKSVADRAMGGMGGWLTSHMELMFRIARNLAPILVVTYKGQRFALVTRYDDVVEVLSRPDVFDVTYAAKIRVIMDGGNIFLGMPDTTEAFRDRTTMRMAAPRAEAMTRIGPETAVLAEAVMEKAAPAGRVDLAMELTQDVTTRLYSAYFGMPATDLKLLSDQARMLFQFMFADLANDPAFDLRIRPVAAAMRRFVGDAIAERKTARGEHDDMLERCLEFQDIGRPGTDDLTIRNNFIGLIVGALPQPPMLIPQLFDVLLDRPDELAAAQTAAQADDDALLSRYVFEALRYYPLTPGLFRDATADYVLAAGTFRQKTIKAGTRVLAATRSAMFDGRKVDDPKTFRLDRPEYDYIHFGSGMHECFGIYMNRQMLPAVAKSVLKRKNIRRAPGDAGKLTMDGIFAMNLTVEFDA